MGRRPGTRQPDRADALPERISAVSAAVALLVLQPRPTPAGIVPAELGPRIVRARARPDTRVHGLVAVLEGHASGRGGETRHDRLCRRRVGRRTGRQDILVGDLVDGREVLGTQLEIIGVQHELLEGVVVVQDVAR